MVHISIKEHIFETLREAKNELIIKEKMLSCYGEKTTPTKGMRLSKSTRYIGEVQE